MIYCSDNSRTSAAKKIFIEYNNDVGTSADLSLHVCVLATVLNRFGVKAGAVASVCFSADDITNIESKSSYVITSTKDPR